MGGLFQLFVRTVPRDVVAAVARAFGLSSLADTRAFTKADLEREGTVEALENLRPVLEAYYLPCKARLHLTDLDEARAVVVLRHVLRCVGRCLVSMEINRGTTKLTVYSVRRQAEPQLRMRLTRGLFHVDYNGPSVATSLTDALAAQAAVGEPLFPAERAAMACI